MFWDLQWDTSINILDSSYNCSTYLSHKFISNINTSFIRIWANKAFQVFPALGPHIALNTMYIWLMNVYILCNTISIYAVLVILMGNNPSYNNYQADEQECVLIQGIHPPSLGNSPLASSTHKHEAAHREV